MNSINSIGLPDILLPGYPPFHLMATRQQLKDLAHLRLREAEALFAADLFDGCAYLCGYVVELALKARICATLGVETYPPEKASRRLREAFWTHDFDDLQILAGMQDELSADHQELWVNWSIASKWNSNWRYEPQGTYDRVAAEAILNAIRRRPDGVLECISSRW